MAAAAEPSRTATTIVPSLATCSGSRPNSSHTPRTSGVTGMLCSSTANVQPQLAAHSWSTAATPPRVASRSATTGTPECAALRRPAGASRNRLWGTARHLTPRGRSSRPRRAGRWAHSPAIRRRAVVLPGRQAPAERGHAHAGRVDEQPVGGARGTTFVSPVTTDMPASRAAAATLASTASRVNSGKPSSMISDRLIHRGRARKRPGRSPCPGC